ncbi:hypothetical protein LCGC14_0739450 [marine sediment metagenome]|uniref:Uncharacterized protein n=1 Tax=marine sediment metagenome TaxID=412755 RepID=A0A0F9TEF5_9ZZZZ
MIFSDIEIAAICKISYERAQKHKKLQFEFAELAGYVDNEVLYKVYTYAFASGFVLGKKVTKLKGGS